MKSNKSISRNFILTKIHFLPFQKWPKINFSTGKKFQTEYFPWKLKFYIYFHGKYKILKVFFHKIASLIFFLVQKLIFGHFWNCKKWILVKIKFREIDLFDITSFFGHYHCNFFKNKNYFWINFFMYMYFIFLVSTN